MHTHFFNLHKKPLTYCYFVIKLKTIEAVSKSTLFDIILLLIKKQDFQKKDRRGELCWKLYRIVMQIKKKTKSKA